MGSFRVIFGPKAAGFGVGREQPWLSRVVVCLTARLWCGTPCRVAEGSLPNREFGSQDVYRAGTSPVFWRRSGRPLSRGAAYDKTKVAWPSAGNQTLVDISAQVVDDGIDWQAGPLAALPALPTALRVRRQRQPAGQATTRESRLRGQRSSAGVFAFLDSKRRRQ